MTDLIAEYINERLDKYLKILAVIIAHPLFLCVPAGRCVKLARRMTRRSRPLRFFSVPWIINSHSEKSVNIT